MLSECNSEAESTLLTVLVEAEILVLLGADTSWPVLL